MTHCEWVKPMAAEQVYPRLNHPVIVLYDSTEGELKGIIVGEITCAELPNNIAVTGLRTAATSAVGTDLRLERVLDGPVAGGPTVSCGMLLAVQGYPLLHLDGFDALSL